jgi:hypothetical protein
MFSSHLLLYLVLWTSFNWTHSLAGQIVYLERPKTGAQQLSERVFNPKSIVANVSENIHFVAHFESQRAFRSAVLIWDHATSWIVNGVSRRSNGLLQNQITINLAPTMEVPMTTPERYLDAKVD